MDNLSTMDTTTNSLPNFDPHTVDRHTHLLVFCAILGLDANIFEKHTKKQKARVTFLMDIQDLIRPTIHLMQPIPNVVKAVPLQSDDSYRRVLDQSEEVIEKLKEHTELHIATLLKSMASLQDHDE